MHTALAPSSTVGGGMDIANKICNLSLNTQDKVKKEQEQHTVVAPMTSNCCSYGVLNHPSLPITSELFLASDLDKPLVMNFFLEYRNVKLFVTIIGHE